MFYLLARISLWREIFLSTTIISKWQGSPDSKRINYIPGPTNDNQEGFLLEGRKSNLFRYNLHSEVHLLKHSSVSCDKFLQSCNYLQNENTEYFHNPKKKLSLPLNSLPNPRPWKQVVSFISTCNWNDAFCGIMSLVSFTSSTIIILFYKLT